MYQGEKFVVMRFKIENNKAFLGPNEWSEKLKRDFPFTTVAYLVVTCRELVNVFICLEAYGINHW